MSLLDTASLLLTPNAYKEGKLYSVIPSDGSGDMSVTRATTATRVNSAGLVELVPYNLFSYSEQFNNAAWTSSEVAIASNSTTAPDGTLTADTLTASTTNAAHYIFQSINTNSGSTLTFSCFVKNNGGNYVQFLPGGINFTITNPYQNFDLINGTLAQGTIPNSTIENVGNGWYRISSTIEATSTGSAFYFLCPILNGTTGRLDAFTGNGTSGIYIWGAQLNEGTLKPYQKTETRLNIPRLDYSNGTCPSILVEPQRTNLLTYSSSFDNAAWDREDISVTANAAISPSGIQDADKLVPNTNNIDHTIYEVVAAGSSKTFSIYAKADGYNYVFIGANNYPSTDGVFFDLINGVVTTNTGGYTASITDEGDGWYRCSITSSNWPTIYAVICTSANGTSVVHTGNGTSGVLIWGAQFEAGAYATSYIPTTSASVTRNRDLGANDVFSSTFTLNSDFCLFQDFVCFDFGNFPVFWSGGNYILGADYRSYMISYSTTSMLLFGVNEVLTAQINSFTFAANTRYKVAVRRVGSTINWFINGVKYSNGAGTTTTTTIKIRSISGASLGGQNTMLLNEAAIWQNELTDAECIALTTL